MPRQRKNIFPNCSDCLENYQIVITNNIGKYALKYRKKGPNEYNYYVDNFQEWQQCIDEKTRRCPFKLQVPKDLPVKEYKMKCFRCGTKLNCPAEVYRHGKEDLCGECEEDSHSSEYDDRSPNEEDDMKMIYSALVDKYGEC
jgi:hypothetical protein